MNKPVLIAALAATLAFAGSAQAAIIDFTEANSTVITNGGGTLEGDGIFSEITFTISTPSIVGINNNETNVGSSCHAALACERDGVGIFDDELSSTPNSETLTIDFSNPVFVTHMFVLDLFSSASTNDFEVGEYSIDGGMTFIQFGTTNNEKAGSGLSGALIIDVYATASSLVIRAPIVGLTNNDNLGVNDFALAAIAVQEIPLPAASLIFLSGLAGFSFARRSRKVTA